MIHTAIHAKAIDSDRWGTEQLLDQQELSYVRLEPSSKVIRDKNNAEIQLAATMFYDCKNSRLRGHELKEISQDLLRDRASSNSQNSNPGAGIKGGPAAWAFDDQDHWWHSHFDTGHPSAGNRIYIQTGFGGTKRIKKLTYQPRTDDKGGIIKDYEIKVSTVDNPGEDQNNWKLVKSGTFQNNMNEQELVFDTAVDAKWIRLIAVSESYNKTGFENFATAKNIRVLEEIPVWKKNAVFKTDDIVIFNGEQYRVQICELLYDGRRPHHYELGLVRRG